MGMGPSGIDDLMAAAIVDSNGVLTKSRGCRVVNNANVYEITLDRELDEYDCAVSITVRGADGSAAAFPMVEHTSDSLKKVRFFFTSGGAVQALNFSVQFRRVASGGV